MTGQAGTARLLSGSQVSPFEASIMEKAEDVAVPLKDGALQIIMHPYAIKTHEVNRLILASEC